jgi:hypothetical protein
MGLIRSKSPDVLPQCSRASSRGCQIRRLFRFIHASIDHVATTLAPCLVPRARCVPGIPASRRTYIASATFHNALYHRQHVPVDQAHDSIDVSFLPRHLDDKGDLLSAISCRDSARSSSRDHDKLVISSKPSDSSLPEK